MQKLKLTELLKSFTPPEIKRLGEFVRSPFFNKNKKLISLFDFLEKAITESAYDNITKEDLWQYMNPGEEYNDLKVRSFLSDFKKLCERFISITEAEKSITHQKNLLLMFCSERHLEKNLSANSKELSNLFKNEFNKNYDYYNNKINYERTLISHKGKNIEINLDSEYSVISGSIDNYFFSSKLDLINSLISRKYHVLGNTSFDIRFSKEIISFIEENLHEIEKSDPVIYSEYLILMMMTANDSEKFFTSLHSFVLRSINKYNHSELEQVYFPLINYGFNKVSMGESIYLKKNFDIYKTFEKKGFYRNMNSIQNIDFISIINVGLSLKNTLWVEKFFERYKLKLMPEYKEDTINLIKALIYFKKKNYEQSLKLLNEVNYQNSYYYLKAKETLMQIYYEQNEFEALESLIDSTRHYLKRRRNVLSIHYDRYLMFLKLLNLLVRSRQENKDFESELKSGLKNNKNVIARDWLAEKVKELDRNLE